MGEGDAKLMIFIGAFTGWQGALFAILAGSVQGVIGAAILAVAKRSRAGKTAARDPDEHAEPIDGTLRLGDGTEVKVSESGARLDIKDARGREVYDYVVASDEEVRLMKRAIPFGPFLALGALEFYFFGPMLIERYFALLGAPEPGLPSAGCELPRTFTEIILTRRSGRVIAQEAPEITDESRTA